MLPAVGVEPPLFMTGTMLVMLRCSTEVEPRSTLGGTMKHSDRVLGALLILAATVTVAYWLNYFVLGDVSVSTETWYTAFEDAFPIADGWMSLCMLAAGIGLWRDSRYGALFGLMAGSALVYLAAMDITFNVEHGLYAMLSSSGAMVIEAIINVTSLALGIATLLMCWRRAASRSISG